jgi:cysteine synthase A
MSGRDQTSLPPQPVQPLLFASVWDCVGRTPLIEVRSLSQLTGCRILGKAEFLNPGGSVKDRTARAIIESAEGSGSLQPGGTIYEGSAGNTGIGLALLGRARGYRVVITIPDNQAQEKYQMLEALGAEVHRVKPVPFANQEHFYHQARRLAEADPKGFWANQFENLANARTHEAGTGAEIWAQTNGQVDLFVSAVGTGGTLGGVSRALKSRRASVRAVLADPMGSGLFSHFRSGEIKSEGSSVTEGIGIMRLTANYKQALVDDAVQVSDQEMIDILFHVARHDGLFLGTSAALNLAAAYRLGLLSPAGTVITTILCDAGTRYASKLLNSDWLREKGLQPRSLAQRVASGASIASGD